MDKLELSTECCKPGVSSSQSMAAKSCWWRSMQDPAVSVPGGGPGFAIALSSQEEEMDMMGEE